MTNDNRRVITAEIDIATPPPAVWNVFRDLEGRRGPPDAPRRESREVGLRLIQSAPLLRQANVVPRP